MTLEKKQILIDLGIKEEIAEFYLQRESDIWAVLPFSDV